MSRIKGSYRSKKQSHTPHRIVISHNMKLQGYKAPEQEFKDYQEAYYYGCGKWGSGSFNNPLGWGIEFFDLETKEWTFAG